MKTGTQYKIYKLSSLLKPYQNKEAVEVGKKYKLLGVSLEGRGVFLREEKTGERISATYLSRVKEGLFIYSRLFAWKGAFDLIPEELNNAYVSNEFPLFSCNNNLLFLPYLKWYFRQKKVWEEVERFCSGTTKASRNRFKEQFFLNLEISLPSLPEQRRIVAKLEHLFAKISEAKKLRQQILIEMEATFDVILSRVFNENTLCRPISDIIDKDIKINRESRDPSKSNPNNDFLYLDISGVEAKTGRILEAKKIKGCDAPSRARRVMKTNDVLFSTVRPYLKSFAIVPPNLDNQICSTGFDVFSCAETVLPKFLWYQLLSPFFIKQCEEKMRGAHYPALNEANLMKIKLIIPNIKEQNRIVKHLDNLQAKIDRLKQLQQATQAELATLMPSILSRAFKGELLG